MALSGRSRAKGTHLSTVTVDQLPLEVWAKVFEYLRPSMDAVDVVGDGQPQNVAKVMTEQACFHQLKLVCSKFRDVFAEHPELSREIIISKVSSAASTFVPSILLWIQRWRSSIAFSTPLMGSSIMS